MSLTSFKKFMREEQKQELSSDQCRKIIKKFEFEYSENKLSFTKQGFTHFLMFNEWTEVVSPMARNKSSIKDEYMRHPLSHYWIASSHNT